MIWGMDIAVLCGRVLSCCNLLLNIWMAGWTGTEVNWALTSKEVMLFLFFLFFLSFIHNGKYTCTPPYYPLSLSTYSAI